VDEDEDEIDMDVVEEALNKAVKPFLFHPVNDETIGKMKGALEAACLEATGKTPYVEADMGEVWKNQISFDVTWDDGHLEVKIGPDSICDTDI
jgi:hypothetical protein